MKTEKTQRLRRRSGGSALWKRAAGVCDGWIVRPRAEEVGNPSVETFHSPRRRGKILRNFDFVLPKFHFILPKFHFDPPWGIFIFS